MKRFKTLSFMLGMIFVLGFGVSGLAQETPAKDKTAAQICNEIQDNKDRDTNSTAKYNFFLTPDGKSFDVSKCVNSYNGSVGTNLCDAKFTAATTAKSKANESCAKSGMGKDLKSCKKNSESCDDQDEDDTDSDSSNSTPIRDPNNPFSIATPDDDSDPKQCYNGTKSEYDRDISQLKKDIAQDEKDISAKRTEIATNKKENAKELKAKQDAADELGKTYKKEAKEANDDVKQKADDINTKIQKAQRDLQDANDNINIKIPREAAQYNSSSFQISLKLCCLNAAKKGIAGMNCPASGNSGSSGTQADSSIIAGSGVAGSAGQALTNQSNIVAINESCLENTITQIKNRLDDEVRGYQKQVSEISSNISVYTKQINDLNTSSNQAAQDALAQYKSDYQKSAQDISQFQQDSAAEEKQLNDDITKIQAQENSSKSQLNKLQNVQHKPGTKAYDDAQTDLKTYTDALERLGDCCKNSDLYNSNKDICDDSNPKTGLVDSATEKTKDSNGWTKTQKTPPAAPSDSGSAPAKATQ